MKKLLLTLIVSFALCGTMFAQTYSTHWPDFDYHQYSDNKGLVAYVNVEGQFADADNYQRYEVAAFVGDECRGVSFLQDETSLGDDYPAFQMQVYYDDATTVDEELSFKLYDHETGAEYIICTPTISGVSTTLSTKNWYLGVWGEPDPNEAIVLRFNYAQKIQLASGTNWVSFNANTTLNDLKAALVEVSPEATIKISGQSTSTTYVPRTHRWNGSLQWDLAQMYKISVTEACEIILEGMRIDPAAHPVTIVKGANYIAFPFTKNMSLTDAFAGFAANGDKVLSKTSSATYNRNRWQGQGLTNLEPGNGYIYKSVSPEDRLFVFPTNAKK